MAQGTSGYEYPEQSYYPRWKVRLILRFAEFGQLGKLQKQAPKKPARSLNGVDLTRGNLQAVPDPTAPPGVNRFVVKVAGTTTVLGPPQSQVSSSDGLTQVLEGVVPRDFKWHRAGIRTGDALNMTLRFADCPIDPRTLRSCAVEFYLGTVTAAQAADFIMKGDAAASSSGATGAAAEPVDLLPSTYTDSNGKPRTNLRFQGWVTIWKVEWSDGELPVIRLECVDNTNVLITTAAPAKAVVSATDPLDKAIAKYLSAFPTMNGISVEYRPQGMTPPVIKDVVAASALRPGLGPPLARGGGAQHEKLSVWDYLTDICRSMGHSIFVDGTTVVIQRVRTLTSDNVQGRADDPYQPRTLPDGTTLPVRRMVYGRNVKKMEVGRNFTKHAPQNISVRAYNTEKKQILVERFPLPGDEQVTAHPGDGTTDQKWMEISVGGGIIDRPLLRQLAQEYYENLGRQEIGWTVETYAFASFGGGNEDPDLLDMSFGDPLEILVARDEQYSTISQDENAMDAVGANAQRLMDAGFDATFANAYAKAYTDSGFPTVYRTHEIETSGDVENGVSFKIYCVNYVAVTSDKSLAAGEEPPTTNQNKPATPPGNAPPGVP